MSHADKCDGCGIAGINLLFLYDEWGEPLLLMCRTCTPPKQALTEQEEEEEEEAEDRRWHEAVMDGETGR